MKKITKLLSVLLAIAVIICPMMSAVVVNAENTTGNDYSLTKDGDVATLTITSTNGFMVYQASVAFGNGSLDNTYSQGGYINGIKVGDYAVIGSSNNNNNLPIATANLKNGVLTFIVASTDAGCDDLYSSVTVLLKLSGTDATVTLTKLQAADDGDGQGVSSDPELLAFPGVDNASNGEIDPDDDYAKENAKPATHTHAVATTVAAQAATCVAKGTQGYVTCSCGKVFTDNTCVTETTIAEREIDIDPNAHVWGEWVYNDDATHLKDGTETRTCTLNSEHKENQNKTGTCLVDDHTYVYYAEGEKTDTTHTVKCECGATKTEGHTFVGGFCSVCGYEEPAPAAVEDASLVFVSKSPEYSDTGIVLNLRIENSIYDKYDDVEVVVTPDRYDSKGMRVAEPISYTFKKSLNEFTNAGANRKNVKVTGFYLYELSLSFSYKINCYDDGKLIKYSPTYTYSIEQWMKERIANVSIAGTMKTLCVDTLVVCDAFQTNMATVQFKESDLAADYAAHRVTDNVDLSIATQDIGTCNTIDDFKPYDAAYGTNTSATHQVKLSVTTETTPYITIRVVDTNSVLDFSKLSITASYTAVDSKGEHPQTKTFNGILSDTNPDGFSKIGKFIQAQYTGIALQDNCRTITISATYDGTKIFDYEYSLETYEYANKDNASIGAAMTALIKLGKSYRTHNNIA